MNIKICFVSLLLLCKFQHKFMLRSSQLSATLMTEPVLTLQKSPNFKKINLKTRENQPTAYE